MECEKWSIKQILKTTLCNPMGCTLLGFSVHGIFQARILEWVAISFSRGSSWLRDRTLVSCIAGRFFTIWATREAPNLDRTSMTCGILVSRPRIKPSLPALEGRILTTGLRGVAAKTTRWENSLEVQWLGLCIFTARARVQSLVRELRSHKPLSSAKKRQVG